LVELSILAEIPSMPLSTLVSET